MRANKRSRRRVKNKKLFKNYSFYFKTDLIPFATPYYTQQNLKFNLLALLNENVTFLKLKDIYQSYKIRFVTFKAIPRMVSGISPRPCFIYLDTQDLMNFNYSAIPTLQRSKMLNGRKTQTIKLKSQGRQDDFNYWFDTTDGPNASIRLRSEAEPTNQIFWEFQLGFAVLMRGMVLPVQEEKQDYQEVGKIKNNPSQEKRQELKLKVLTDSFELQRTSVQNNNQSITTEKKAKEPREKNKNNNKNKTKNNEIDEEKYKKEVLPIIIKNKNFEIHCIKQNIKDLKNEIKNNKFYSQVDAIATLEIDRIEKGEVCLNAIALDDAITFSINSNDVIDMNEFKKNYKNKLKLLYKMYIKDKNNIEFSDFDIEEFEQDDDSYSDIE